MRIKICGITRIEDALLVGELGAWAIGLIFVPSSPRVLTPERAKEIVSTVDSLYPDLLKIGVFADQPEDFISHTVTLCGLDGIQLHGKEPPEFLENFDCKLRIKAFTISDGIDTEDLVEEMRDYRGYLPLIDIPKGQNVSQDILLEFAFGLKRLGIDFIVAGGIGLDNITRFLSLDPYAIDIARGVEVSPGVKDREKLLKIFRLVKGDESGVQSTR